MLDKITYARGTYFLVRMPWAVFAGGAALCPDGKVRKLKRISVCADTFFSVPASVVYKGRTIAGYCTTDNDVIEFRPYEYRKNGGAFTGAIIDNDFMVCEDCLHAIAYDDYTGLDYHYDEKEAYKRMREIKNGIHDAKGSISRGDSEKDVDFSRAPCECCGSGLAGGRFHCVMLVK